MKIELTEGSEVTIYVEGCDLCIKLRKSQGELCGIIAELGSDTYMNVAPGGSILLTNESSYALVDQLKQCDDDSNAIALLGEELIRSINQKLK
jgi:hypothetical protein